MKGKLDNVMNDTNLSWGAKGLMTLLLNASKNGEYGSFKKEKIAHLSKGNIDNILKELMQKGYISLWPERKDDGTFKEWVYLFFYEPKRNPNFTPIIEAEKQY